MDNIKFPKSFALSRENMHAIFDAFGDGRSVVEIAAELAQAASSKKVSRPPVKAASRSFKPGSRSSKSARPFNRDGSSSTSTPAEGSRETSLAIVEQAQATGQVGQGAPAPVRTEPEGTPKTGEKRSTPSGASAPSPARKKPRTAARPSPPLPPIGKGKSVSAVPSSSPTVDVLDPSAITSESPASAVAALLRKRMFSGTTEALDPRLLALTGHLASSTKEQVSFRSRSREELGSTIREMLLMVTGLFMEVDARDHSLRESVDRQIEEARRDENLIATSDARGHLVAAREQIQTLQVELHSAREATKKAEDKAAEAAEHSKSLESELSRTCGILQETDKRAAEVEARCERDDAIGQKAEVQRQHEALKADFERLQAYLDEVKAQKGGALARVEVLEQELGAMDSDGESVLYGEDDFPMPRGDSRRNRDRPAESCSEGSELGSGEDDPDSEKESLHPGSDVGPTINVESSGPKDTELPSERAVNRGNAGECVFTDP
ncbi:cell wall protein RBR3-like [Manihot esculenta]|uniref:cell wall protein RBR3-like n=1 Tax=Manihot esculenta TaxID=3983 RepID=UPI001CC3C009|nr:cell wall protein RBR3-like [Manihot esculenta]